MAASPATVSPAPVTVRVTRAIVGFGQRADFTVMHRCNGWRAPRWLRLWMVAATRGGDGWLWYGIGLVVALFGGPDRFHAILAAVLAAATGVAMFIKLKRSFGRRRPCTIEPHCWATLLPPDQFSFPSGHTITAFAVAVPLIYFYPTLALGLLFCAGSIALSRIMLGLHFLSDVVVGCALGTLLGIAAIAIV